MYIFSAVAQREGKQMESQVECNVISDVCLLVALIFFFFCLICHFFSPPSLFPRLRARLHLLVLSWCVHCVSFPSFLHQPTSIWLVDIYLVLFLLTLFHNFSSIFRCSSSIVHSSFLFFWIPHFFFLLLLVIFFFYLFFRDYYNSICLLCLADARPPDKKDDEEEEKRSKYSRRKHPYDSSLANFCHPFSVLFTNTPVPFQQNHEYAVSRWRWKWRLNEVRFSVFISFPFGVVDQSSWSV